MRKINKLISKSTLNVLITFCFIAFVGLYSLGFYLPNKEVIIIYGLILIIQNVNFKSFKILGLGVYSFLLWYTMIGSIEQSEMYNFSSIFLPIEILIHQLFNINMSFGGIEIFFFGYLLIIAIYGVLKDIVK